MDKFVIVEQQGAVGLIRLNRPEVRNALNGVMIVALDRGYNSRRWRNTTTGAFHSLGFRIAVRE
jgi:enoyl-CoA hydratase/carnithine racemase